MLCQLYVYKPAVKVRKEKKDKKLTPSWSQREIIWTPIRVSDIFEFQQKLEVSCFRLDSWIFSTFFSTLFKKKAKELLSMYYVF